MPHNLLGVDCPAVNDRRNLAVRTTCIETNAAAIYMPSHFFCLLIGLREGSFFANHYLEGAFVDILHKADVKMAETSRTVFRL